MNIPVFRPLLPTVSEIGRYLAEMDANRWYTNHGPLVRTFERRLADACGIAEESVITSANATVALTQVLLALVGKKAEDRAYCITPSWTFVATAASIQAAGLEPYFADVAADTWALDPHSVEALISHLHR